ncbi:hypothetical protein PQH03_29010 [Ralstonia insidiosa]|jgi:hypothetical protein|uniref:Uncharacterized protein n=2 Tax=Pseudomonadota TaxID=1224 RepID=A0A192A7V4_9RALS|nr:MULTISPECIES: hypothetical protein [Ralstonia]KMW47657.1 hypothetical protein AC240_08955 [Ralstonia sp. MD27]ANJ76418.1 hypothetical protein A9Y76_27880 [Ralstonia insidiosa]MBA9869730.1 hypothetical protein [Ralstonia insidiosa]MBA9885013.1 hypothetical protein [Ralstonia pickettii]MBA9894765.1 hypothetical protein [Ralstonia pickettii]
MSFQLRRRADLRASMLAIKSAIAENIPVKEHHLNEAIAFGYGLPTYASLVASLASGHTYAPSDFRHLAFLEHLETLSDDRPMAESAAAAACGITIQIDITKRSPERQRSDDYLDIAYDVDLMVNGLSPESLEASPTFLVPSNFGGPHIRLASASTHKVDGEFAVTRNRNKRDLVSVKLIRGQWAGGLFLDIRPDADAARYLRSAKAALVREIIQVVNPWVNCRIFRPDAYDYGAWRVEMSLGQAGLAALGSSRLVFDIPRHQERLVVPDKEYLFDINPAQAKHLGQFQDGIWAADVYSNGISEDANDVKIDQLRKQFVRSVYQKLAPV